MYRSTKKHTGYMQPEDYKKLEKVKNGLMPLRRVKPTVYPVPQFTNQAIKKTEVRNLLSQ